LHESRLRYLEHLAAQGAALHTITTAAGIIYRAAIWIKLDESGPVERKDVERAAERWAKTKGAKASPPARSMSKAARNKIAAAQRARWAKARAQQKKAA